MGERGIDEIIVVADAGNGRIGIIARQYGIDIFAWSGLHLLDRLAVIGEALEASGLGLRRRAGQRHYGKWQQPTHHSQANMHQSLSSLYSTRHDGVDALKHLTPSRCHVIALTYALVDPLARAGLTR